MRTQGFAEMQGGKAVRLFGTFQDITVRKQAEAAQATVAAQLRQAQKMEAIGQLAAASPTTSTTC